MKDPIVEEVRKIGWSIHENSTATSPQSAPTYVPIQKESGHTVVRLLPGKPGPVKRAAGKQP